jgi:TBC1 domain family member 10
MTTLEIKRLDSSNKPPNNFNSSNYYNSPNKKAFYNQQNRNSISSSSLHNFDNEDEFVKEIPISIIKSPSSINNVNSNSKHSITILNSSQPTLLANKPNSPNQIKSSIIVNNTGLLSSPLPSTNNLIASNLHLQAKDPKASIENKQHHSHIQVPSSSNITLDTTNPNNSCISEDLTNVSTNNSIEESGTLRFNKYGFIQPNDTFLTFSSDTKTNFVANTQNRVNSTNDDSLKINNLSVNLTSPILNQQSNSSSSVSLSQKEKETINDDALKNSANVTNASTNLKEYLQKTNVEEFAENLAIEKIRSRELKWIKMLKNFDEWMRSDFKKIRSRCRKGIPQSMRSKAWMHLTGAFLLKQQKPNYYLECLNNINNIDVNKYIEDIKKDLHRQFPGHEIFMKREGRQMLFNVLKAYAVHNKEVGYCQAQGPIAAVLLMHMPEEDSFWMLIRISDYYLKGYFKPGLEKVQIDGKAIFYLFKKENLNAYKLMKTQSIDPILFMTEWFMCIYARTLPWCTILRVWDMFFCEGVKVLYRVGLYLMCCAFSNRPNLEHCAQQGMYETLDLLKNLPVKCLKEDHLVIESSLIKISENDMSKAFQKSRKEFIKQSIEINKIHKQNISKSSNTNKNKIA